MRCRVCGWQQDRDLDDLVSEIRGNGGSHEWRIAHLTLQCGAAGCQGRVSLVPLPYTKVAKLERRYERLLIKLPLDILYPYGPQRPTGTIAVRLALRVLLPYVEAKEALADTGTSPPTNTRRSG